MLAEVLLVGSDGVGSLALARSKTTTLAMSLGALLDQIVGVVNRTAIPRLAAHNDIAPELTPTLEHGDIESPDFGEFTAAIASAAGAGFLIGDEDVEREIKRRGGIEMNEEAA